MNKRKNKRIENYDYFVYGERRISSQAKRTKETISLQAKRTKETISLQAKRTKETITSQAVITWNHNSCLKNLNRCGETYIFRLGKC